MNINWDSLVNVWTDFVGFFETVFNWLLFVFGVRDTWEPETKE